MDESTGSDTLAIVRFPFRQESIDFRAYAEPLLDGSVLEWALSRISGGLPSGVRLVCICATAREHERLSAICGDRTFTFLQRGEPSEMVQCRQLMEEFHVSRIISFRLAHAILSIPTVFRAIVQLHNTVEATLSEASTSVIATPMYIIDSAAVDVLVTADPLQKYADLFHAIEHARSSAEAAGDTATSHWFQMDLGEVLKIPAERWPERVSLDTMWDVRILREAVLRHAGPDALHYVDAWKSATIALSRSEREENVPVARESTPVISRKTCGIDVKTRPRRRRILYLSATSYFHGASQSLCHLIDGLDRDRYEPVVVTAFAGQLTDQLRRRGVRVIAPNEPIETLDGRSLAVATRLVREIAPDLAHGNHRIGAPFVAALAGAQVPLVQHVRVATCNGLELEVHSADALIAVSELVKRRLRLVDVHPDDIDVVWPGIHTDSFKPSPDAKALARRELGLPADEFIVAAIGRMTRYKHHETVVSAVKHLRRQTGRGHLLLVSALDGERDYYDEIFTLIREEGLTSHVRHIEFTTDVPTVLHASDALAMMSKNEAFGRVAAEAMAAGRAVVTGTLTGAAEIIEHGVNGYVVPDQDLPALVSVLAEISADSLKAERIGAAAAATVRNKLDAPVSAARTMAVYDRVLARRATSTRMPNNQQRFPTTTT